MKTLKLSLNLIAKLYLFAFFAALHLSCSPALINLDTAKEEVARYYESGQYGKELTTILEDAKEKFSKADVMANSVVVLDVDETALDNYEIIKKLGYGYEPKYWDDWLQNSTSPAIQKVKEFYDFLLSRGFKIIFITGQKDYQYETTYKNLKAVGYNKFDTLIVRNKDEYKLNSALYKSQKRKELTQKGYEIAGCVGDQESDCDGDNCGIVIKLPNYLYIVK